MDDAGVVARLGQGDLDIGDAAVGEDGLGNLVGGDGQDAAGQGNGGPEPDLLDAEGTHLEPHGAHHGPADPTRPAAGGHPGCGLGT